MLLLALSTNAHAFIDPACLDDNGDAPEMRLEEEGQANFLQNYPALSTSFSAIHAPIPHDPGTGSIGVEVFGIPPLACDQRLVLGGTKTEDTNKTPAAPRFRLGFSMPEVGPAVIYGTLGYVPPMTVAGTRNVILSGEIGVGIPLESGLQLGARYHHTLQKTVGEIATPFIEGDPPYDDFYSAATLGLDLMAGYELEKVTPYVAVGVMDASTFFVVADDAYLANNTAPYVGMTGSVGAQALLKDKIELAGEFYTALPSFSAEQRALGSGHVYTGRVRVGLRFGEPDA
ncbi:MAG: hypothetical protein GY913_22330 [Proteobacteria bacterium]|nr:hypothetical protein [Pseudomonadota bacterium]MCP4919649.1 hypothetical protein [Pseudomonadota bacterium]